MLSNKIPIENDKTNNLNKDFKEMQKDPNINKIYFKKYKVLKRIGEGSFGSIYEGINIQTNEKIAIKLEDRAQYNLLEEEGYTLFTLKGFGIVELISYGRNKEYNIMIQPLLGDSIYKIFLNCKKNFTLKDICLIGLQCLDRLEWIHNKNFIHCDIKPENFLFGRKDPKIIYMIDFGLSKKYRSERTMKHIIFRTKKKLTGTARFASVNSLKGYELSRRDDMESFCYMILFFILKKLPWQGIKSQNQYKRLAKICEIKEKFNIDDYKEKIPFEIITIFKYVKKLKFEEEPNYYKIRNLFKKFLKKINYNDNETFSWIKDKDTFNSKNITEPNKRKLSYKNTIIENILKKHILNNSMKNNIKHMKKEQAYSNISFKKSCLNLEYYNSPINEIVSNNNIKMKRSGTDNKLNYENENSFENKLLLNKKKNSSNNIELSSIFRRVCSEYRIGEEGSKNKSILNDKKKIIIKEKLTYSRVDKFNNNFSNLKNNVINIQKLNNFKNSRFNNSTFSFKILTNEISNVVKTPNNMRLKEYRPKFISNNNSYYMNNFNDNNNINFLNKKYDSEKKFKNLVLYN